jgi:hypothetical protein
MLAHGVGQHHCAPKLAQLIREFGMLLANDLDVDRFTLGGASR